MNDSRKLLLLAIVFTLIAFLYFAPIIPAETCPSLIPKCASMGEGNMSLPDMVEAWVSFFLP